jgi:hypothetical protein
VLTEALLTRSDMAQVREISPSDLTGENQAAQEKWGKVWREVSDPRGKIQTHGFEIQRSANDVSAAVQFWTEPMASSER